MDLNIEVKMWSDDIRKAIIEAAAKAMPPIPGYVPVIDSVPYFSGPVIVRMAKAEEVSE